MWAHVIQSTPKMDKSTSSSSAPARQRCRQQSACEQRKCLSYTYVLSEEICKVDREAVVLSWKERPCVAIDRKLDSGLYADCPVHTEQAWTEKHLISPAAGQPDHLPLKSTGSLSGELAEYPQSQRG
jgi:hypothetical protein